MSIRDIALKHHQYVVATQLRVMFTYCSLPLAQLVTGTGFNARLYVYICMQFGVPPPIHIRAMLC